MTLKAGDAAPDFVLDSENGLIRLESFAKRVLVLYFYPKDDTSGCTAQARGFSEAAAEFAAANAMVVGVSRDPLKSHAKFRAKYGLDLILASDEAGEVTERYGVWVEKSMYGRKYMGIERVTFLIDRVGVIRRVWRKVKVPGHVAEVLAAVRALTKEDK